MTQIQANVHICDQLIIHLEVMYVNFTSFIIIIIIIEKIQLNKLIGPPNYSAFQNVCCFSGKPVPLIPLTYSTTDPELKASRSRCQFCDP